MRALQLEPLDATFGARVHNLGLASVDEPTFEALYEAWLEHALLVFSDQFMTRDEQITLARRFGELEFEIAALSNVMADGNLRPDDGTDEVVKVLRGNMGWHHDSTYMPVQAKGAVFTAEVVPSQGGATGFADMRAAYDALDDGMRARITSLRAHHSLYHSQAKVGHVGKGGTHGQGGFDDNKDYSGYGFHDGPVSVRPLVKTHPETGRKLLYVNEAFTSHIHEVSREESKAVLEFLYAHQRRPEWSIRFRWQPHSVAFWDNRCAHHRATSDYLPNLRSGFRVQVNGTVAPVAA